MCLAPSFLTFYFAPHPLPSFPAFSDAHHPPPSPAYLNGHFPPSVPPFSSYNHLPPFFLVLPSCCRLHPSPSFSSDCHLPPVLAFYFLDQLAPCLAFYRLASHPLSFLTSCWHVALPPFFHISCMYLAALSSHASYEFAYPHPDTAASNCPHRSEGFFQHISS
uniref:Uncharacterized protein n=1 Tax=Opuntia streptacantha TaxID=393608 RepID=A0A7C9EKC3_OPUST